MISSTIRQRKSSASTGNITSTRRSKFRGIQSALDRNTCCFAPSPNTRMRLCSRKRSTMLRTRMFSEMPGSPGRRQQMPRITRSIGTPAWLAR